MKKMISLLAAALLVTVFAAGCGKFTTCGEAKKKDDCVADKFEKDKFKCKWEDKANGKEGEGECKEETAQADPAKDCAAISTPTAQKDCDKVAAAGGKKCEFVAGTPAKCEWK